MFQGPLCPLTVLVVLVDPDENKIYTLPFNFILDFNQ